MLAPHRIKHIVQKDWYCGPATLAMLYSVYGRDFSQDRVAEATGIRSHIPTRGCRVDQLAAAVQDLTPDYLLMGKYDSSVEDLVEITVNRGLPVAVEWRGTFLEPNGHVWEEGHYSIVETVNLAARTLNLIDPFNGNNIAHQNGRMLIDDFVQRWWDDNYLPTVGTDDILDPETWVDHIFTDRLIFALVSRSQVDAFTDLGFQPLTVEFSRRCHKAGRVLDPGLSYRPSDLDVQEDTHEPGT
ncbi:MAG: C39 family peptidase [Chloroflexi bacterium]|nr:C39 family peptidase [Chloroflexota bacterium]